MAYSLSPSTFHSLVLCLTFSTLLLGGSGKLEQLVGKVAFGVRHAGGVPWLNIYTGDLVKGDHECSFERGSRQKIVAEYKTLGSLARFATAISVYATRGSNAQDFGDARP